MVANDDSDYQTRMAESLICTNQILLRTPSPHNPSVVVGMAVEVRLNFLHFWVVRFVASGLWLASPSLFLLDRSRLFSGFCMLLVFNCFFHFCLPRLIHFFFLGPSGNFPTYSV